MVTLHQNCLPILLSGLILFLALETSAQSSEHQCLTEKLTIRQDIDSFLHLSAHTCIYVDKTSTLSLDEVLLAWERNDFIPLAEYRWEGDFQRGKYVYWLRFSVLNATDALLQPVLSCGQETSLQLFNLSSAVGTPRIAGRESHIGTSRDSLIFSGRFLFPLSLQADSVQVFMLRLQSVPGFPDDAIPLLYNQGWLAKKNMVTLFPYYLITGAFLGFLLFALLFSLMQYIQRRNKSYLYSVVSG